MFSSLLRPKQSNRSRRIDRLHDRHSPSPGPAYRHYGESRHAVADFTEAEDEEEEEEEEEEDDGLAQSGDDPDAVDDEDPPHRTMPVLPLFSESYLGKLEHRLAGPPVSIKLGLTTTSQTPCLSTASPTRFASSFRPEPKRR